MHYFPVKDLQNQRFLIFFPEKTLILVFNFKVIVQPLVVRSPYSVPTLVIALFFLFLSTMQELVLVHTYTHA